MFNKEFKQATAGQSAASGRWTFAALAASAFRSRESGSASSVGCCTVLSYRARVLTAATSTGFDRSRRA